jgi:hypothetical protein
VPIADLLRDPRLVPSAVRGEARGILKDFIARRVRALIDADPSLADPVRRMDVSAAATPGVATRLIGEIPHVNTAYATISSRIRTDAAHLSLSPATIRKRVSTRPPTKDARAMRKRLVRSIVYQAAARDITLADAANVERLHKLTDRRLRFVERMLYDVGSAGHRRWRRSQIAANPGGPWKDGLERAFEYPRVPQWAFRPTCNPDGTTGKCQTAGMTDWRRRGSEHLVGPIRTNPGTRAAWRENGYYRLDYQTGHLPNAVAAIEGLFATSTDYEKRCLLFCDHVIHVLHLEALTFAETKRGAGTAWLDSASTTGGPGWLRIYYPFSSARFLASVTEPMHFQTVEVREADLQVGDHLIVYNHPAYDDATIAGVWRLENAVVVQTWPQLRMQGHGSRVYTKGGMWRAMVGLFNAELNRRRANVLAHIQSGAPGTPLFGGRFVSFKVENDVELVRRVDPAASEYDGRHRRADWYLVWDANTEERAIRLDPAKAAFVKQHQLIEYTEETDGVTTRIMGWFPLWKPTLRRGNPIKRAGKIIATEPVRVHARNIAGWTWFFDADPARRDLVPVLRPKVT